jgi:ribose transport system substrate-binding protein
MQQRYTGVSQGLRESGAVVEWSLEGKAESIKDAFYTLEQDKPVDILIALGNDETEMMVDFFAGDELGWRLDRCSLYGVGSSEKNVYYLDKGWIQTLVVPNEFNMGYQSMEAIAKQLIYHMDTTRSSKVNYLVVDREHLYDADIQKVLFPIVQ